MLIKLSLQRVTFVLLLPLFASAQITPDNEWFACSVATDCVVERDPCWLEEAVNKKYLADYRDWRLEIQQVMACPEESGRKLAGKRKGLRPTCNSGRCTMRVIGKAEDIFKK